MKMLKSNTYHSPEQSETDPDNEQKCRVVVHDYSWRSDEVCQIIILSNFVSNVN